MYANDFDGISAAVARNTALVARIQQLVETDAIPGKVTEGTGRIAALRAVLQRLFRCEIDFNTAVAETAGALPRHSSPHSNDNRVFGSGWEERLVRTQVSRFYNQAVLLELVEKGAKECAVDHSKLEKPESECSQRLAGARHDPKVLLDRLVRSYRDGQWTADLKVPHHPHCTHTVRPCS